MYRFHHSISRDENYCCLFVYSCYFSRCVNSISRFLSFVLLWFSHFYFYSLIARVQSSVSLPRGQAWLCFLNSRSLHFHKTAKAAWKAKTGKEIPQNDQTFPLRQLDHETRNEVWKRVIGFWPCWQHVKYLNISNT